MGPNPVSYLFSIKNMPNIGSEVQNISVLFGAVNLAARLSPLRVFENVRYAFPTEAIRDIKPKGVS